jgi:hypothetical protein
MFRDIPSDFMPLSNPAASITELKPGDALQIVYYEKSDTLSVPRQVNDYIVLERDVKPEFPVTRIAFTSTDLFSGVTMNNDTVEIQELPDGLFIGNNLAIPYAAYKSGFSRIDPAEGEWRCYILPREDFSKPLLELVFQESQKLHDTSFDILRYWNSELPYRINWIRDFPLPFQEYELLKPSIKYVKRGDVVRGKKFEINVALKPGIRYFDETPNGLRLTVFVALKGKYSVSLFDADNNRVNTLPEFINLKSGMQKIEVNCPNKLADRYYKLVFRQEDGSNAKPIQEYVFLSRYF